MPIEEDRAAQREDDLLPLVADVDVGSAGDELLDLALAPGDGRQFQPIRVGMLLDTENLCDADLVAVPHGRAIFRLHPHPLRRRQTAESHPRDFKTLQRETPPAE